MSPVERIIEAIAKNDPDAARVVLADTWWEEAQSARREYFEEAIPRLLKQWEEIGPVLSQRVTKEYVVSKSLDADAVYDPRGVLADYQAMGEILKAERIKYERNGATWYNTVNRDAKGRFTRMAADSPTDTDPGLWQVNGRPNDPRTLPQNVVPLVDQNNQTKRAKFQSSVSEQTKQAAQRYLGAVAQANDLRAETRNILGRQAKNAELVVNFRDRRSAPRVFDLDSEKGLEWSINAGDVFSFEVRPKADTPVEVLPDLMDRLDTANELDALGLRAADERTLRRIDEALNPQNLDQPRTARYANALQAGSEIAGRVGMKSTATTLAASAAALNQGERLRPAITRAAYRYRGTEKRPDADIFAAANLKDVGPSGPEAVADAEWHTNALMSNPSMKLSSVPNQKEKWLQATEDRPSDMVSRVPAQIGSRIKLYDQDFNADPTMEQIRNGVVRDRIAQRLARRLVASESMDLSTRRRAAEQGRLNTGEKGTRDLISEISQGIGRGLPSEGVLLDVDNNVVSQSVGLGGDNYQPFTAAALGKLNGGQYVRTREQGGVSPDDLRTLLMTNGRAATVVSGGGVFDLEFAPTFRGSKRMSDKALGMVETYERILDQLAAEGIYDRDLPPEVERRIRQRALLDSGNDPRSAKYRESLKKLRDTAYYDAASLDDNDLDAITDAGQGLSGREKIRAQNDKKDEIMAEKVRAIRLNGEGYEVALKTLQRYYPYFVRHASRQPLLDLMRTSDDPSAASTLSAYAALDARSGRKDKEYVRPGNVRFGNDSGSVTGLPNTLKRPSSQFASDGSATDRIGDTGSAAGAIGAGTKPSAERGKGGAEQKVEGAEGAEQPKATPVTPPAVLADVSRSVNNKITDISDQIKSAFVDVAGDEVNDDDLEGFVASVKMDDTAKPFADPPNNATIVELIVDTNGNAYPKLYEYIKAKPERAERLLKMINNKRIPDNVQSGLKNAIESTSVLANIDMPWRSQSDTTGDVAKPKLFGFIANAKTSDDINNLSNSPEYKQAAKMVPNFPTSGYDLASKRLAYQKVIDKYGSDEMQKAFRAALDSENFAEAFTNAVGSMFNEEDEKIAGELANGITQGGYQPTELVTNEELRKQVTNSVDVVYSVAHAQQILNSANDLAGEILKGLAPTAGAPLSKVAPSNLSKSVSSPRVVARILPPGSRARVNVHKALRQPR